MRSTTSCTKKHRWSAPSSSFTLGGNRYACSGLYGRNRGISLSASFCLCFSSEFSRTHFKPRPFKARSKPEFSADFKPPNLISNAALKVCPTSSRQALSRSGKVCHLRSDPRMDRGRLARVVNHMVDRAVFAQSHGDHVVEAY